MLVHIGLENGIGGRSLAWALEHPGCFAYGADGSTAIVTMAQAIPDYIAWMEKHTDHPWFSPENIDIRLDDVWEDYDIDEEYRKVKEGDCIQAWFQSDWKPLTQEDIEHGLQLLDWSRSDLLGLVAGLNPDQLDMSFPNERWTIRGILSHVGTADWWLLDRLGLANVPREALSKNAPERMRSQFSRLVEVLPELANVDRVVGKDGEFWSPRKLLRRAVWHERDHFFHIQGLLVRQAAD